MICSVCCKPITGEPVIAPNQDLVCHDPACYAAIDHQFCGEDPCHECMTQARAMAADAYGDMVADGVL